MNFVRQLEANHTEEINAEGDIREIAHRDSAASRQAKSDNETTADNLSTALRRVSGTSTREVDNLIGELRTLREKLQTDGERIQGEIAEYTAFSQSVTQLTKIIAEGITHVKKPRDALNKTGPTYNSPIVRGAQNL